MTHVLRRAGVTAIALFTVASIAVGVTAHRGFLPEDTRIVLQGVARLDDCSHAGIYSSCEWRRGEVGEFPLAQYAIGLTAKRLGATYRDAADLLVEISALAVIGVLLLTGYVAFRLLPPRVALVLLLVVVTSPLLWYSQAGFGEALAAFLALAVVAAVALGAPWPLATAAGLAAGVTKEIAPIFVVLLALGVLLARGGKVKGVLPVAAGAFAAAVLNDLFNVWRYGTLYNDFYADPSRVTPGLGLKADFFAGQLVSPNVGLAVLWPLAALVLAAALGGALRRPLEPGNRGRMVLLLVLVGLLGVFASYHSPYGWTAWGPRYLLPWIPALCLAGALAGPEPLVRLLDWLRAHLASAAALAVVITVLTLPTLRAFLDPQFMFRAANTNAAPPCDLVAPGLHAAYEHPDYYRCINHLTWDWEANASPYTRPFASAQGTLLAVLLMCCIPAAGAAALQSRGSIRR